MTPATGMWHQAIGISKSRAASIWNKGGSGCQHLGWEHRPEGPRVCVQLKRPEYVKPSTSQCVCGASGWNGCRCTGGSSCASAQIGEEPWKEVGVGVSIHRRSWLQHRPVKSHSAARKAHGLWVSRGKNHGFLCISSRA